MRLKWLAFFFILLSLHTAKAAKFDFMAGFFDLSAKTNSGEGQVSNLGSYRLTYLQPLKMNLEMGLGYSLFMSDTVSGDIGFGFDIGFFYFPFSTSKPIELRSNEAYLFVEPTWRPYGGVSFHQRQFQSVESSFAGFSFSAGVERAYKESMNLKPEVRYMILQGPGSAEASLIEIFLGVSFRF